MESVCRCINMVGTQSCDISPNFYLILFCHFTTAAHSSAEITVILKDAGEQIFLALVIIIIKTVNFSNELPHADQVPSFF